MDSTKPTYAAQWNEYRRRRRIYWILFLSYVPGVVLVGFPLAYYFSSEWLGMSVAGLWMLAWVVARMRMYNWRCPRCGDWFFHTFWNYKWFRGKCVHCGLPQWADHDPDLGAAPTEA
jgi:hypothetical protein